MADYSSLLKRLFSKDPNIRYAKQIKQGKVKLVRLPNEKWLTPLRHTLPQMQIPLLVLSILLLLAWSKFFAFSSGFVKGSDCSMWFGLAKPIVFELHLMLGFILGLLGCAPLMLWLYRTTLAKDWRLAYIVTMQDYLVYRRVPPIKRKVFKWVILGYLGLAILSILLNLLDTFVWTEPYQDFFTYNQAMIERCQSQAISKPSTDTPY